MMSSIFLSHNSEDKPFTRRLAKDLRAHGVRVWIDEAEMLVGDSLIRKLDQAIRQMDFLGVVLSPNSVESEWVLKEVEIAMHQEIQGKQIKVLPILYKQCQLPGFLSTKVWADFTKPQMYQTGLNALLGRLRPNESPQLTTSPAHDFLGFSVLNWNVGGSRFLQLRHGERELFRGQMNAAISDLLEQYKPDAVTLQEIVRYGEPGGEVVNELLGPFNGYTYHPVMFLDSNPYSSKLKWEKVRRMGEWPSQTYFAQGNAFLFRESAPVFGILDLSNIGVSQKEVDRDYAIEIVQLGSGLYLGDRDTEPRAALIAHFIWDPCSKSAQISTERRPVDIFVVNLKLSTLIGEREGSPEIDSLAASLRKSQLEIVLNGIVSRYNTWRQRRYPFRGEKRSPGKHETFDRQTPVWILAGDFSFTEVSTEYDFVRRMNFVDSIPNKGTGTKSNGIGRPPVLTLDYVFAGPKFVALTPLIQDNAFLANQVIEKVRLSEHFPMVATISLDLR